MKVSNVAIRNEFDLFHLLTKKYGRQDIEEIFLAIQSGMAFNAKRVDVGRVCGQMMAFKGRIMDTYCAPIGASGLAFFSFLFKVDLEREGGSDYHDYRFIRRHDGVMLIAKLKTATAPESPKFAACYNEMFQKLVRQREYFIKKYDMTETLNIEVLE